MAQAPIVFDRAAESYDATRGFPPGVEDRVADLLVQAGGLGTSSRVLEIGIGTGRIAVPLAARVGAVFGVDLSAPMLARLCAKAGLRPVFPVRADAARLPFPAAVFDAVVGVHVFHLIPGWRDVLREIARVLRPGARLLHAADEQSETWSAWRRQLDERIGYEHVGVPRARFESFPQDEGWRFVEPVHRIEFPRTTLPQELLDRMAKRTWSVTWRLSDDELAQAVDALRTDLLARYGALDRAVELHTGFWVRAYAPPA